MESTFEKLCADHFFAVERFVRFRVANKFDCDDIIQEVRIATFNGFSALKSKDNFKSWILGIARNKVNDHFREKARRMDIPVESITDNISGKSLCGRASYSAVTETIEKLGDDDKQILYLYYWKEYRQSEIAEKLGIPVGTVKSRLHTAKTRFKEIYPYHPKQKGETDMKKLPEILPE